MSHHNMENERWQEERAKLRASLEQSEAQRCRLELQHQQAESAQQVSVSFSWIPFLLKCSSPLDAPWDLYIYIYIYICIYIRNDVQHLFASAASCVYLFLVFKHLNRKCLWKRRALYAH